MTAPLRLAEVFVELADTLVDDFDVTDFLTTLTERSVELLGADAAGLMLADQRGGLELVASTSEHSRLLELFELQADEGPCLDCYATGTPVTNVGRADAARRWPRFAAATTAAGFGGAHAIPLRLRHQVLGALNLFTTAEVRLGDEDVALAQAMADVATIGLLQERSLREQILLSEQLQAALHSRVTLEQAKGVLAAKTGLDVAGAFTALRAHARRHGIPLGEVAAAVIDGTLDPAAMATVDRRAPQPRRL